MTAKPRKEQTMTAFAIETAPGEQNREGTRPALGRAGAFSLPELVVLTAVPLLWGILLLFHPGGEGEQIYRDLQDQVTIWQVVHVGMLLFIPLMAGVVYLLLRGVEGAAAQLSRIALVPFVIFYSAWEAVYGIGNGILVRGERTTAGRTGDGGRPGPRLR
jgi:hypothetical protein